MPEAVEWLPDGTPRSPRFQDIYRSQTGALEQARHVFLHGCGLPGAWAGHSHWTIFETGFGLGTNFLAAWQAWKSDAQRPRQLHFVSLEAWPVAAADVLRSAASYPELNALATELAAQWFGLVPGVHRLTFEGGRVLLTLFIGDVKEASRRLAFTADAVFLDGFDPAHNPAMWELPVLKAMARHCHRGTRIATWSVAGAVRRDLQQCGFVVEKVEGLAPKRQCLSGTFGPAWEPKGLADPSHRAAGQCAVIGGGLAGAAVAASLARRGWTVSVLDGANAPAAGASALPAGLLVPQLSADDNLLSRLTRAGVRITLRQAAASLRIGEDWAPCGVLERRIATDKAFTSEASEWLEWHRPATADQLAAVHWHEGSAIQSCWHERAGWIKPAALIAAWLDQPGVHWLGNQAVHSIEQHDGRHRLLDRAGRGLLSADLVVVAAAHGTSTLVGHDLGLQPIRGQVCWAAQEPELSVPPFAVNGDGHFIPGVPTPLGPSWFCGSTYQRGDTDVQTRAADDDANLTKLEALLPEVAHQIRQSGAQRHSWAGVRCASIDRRPLLGMIRSGLWVSTAMGSRGLTFAALCAELLAAQLHGEPWPLERKLAQALSPARLKP